MHFKKSFICIMIFVTFSLLIGCTGSNPEKVQTAAMDKQLVEIQNQIGMPNIHNFFEKKMTKQIFELRDNPDLITYAYMTNLEGKFIYVGKCIGYGLPYSVQYTNPQKVVIDFGDRIPIAQADPNGLYMPDGLSATWLMLINEKTGEPEIVYTEPNIIVSKSKLPKRLIVDWSLPKDY